eukprot:scaffold7103_cov39-Tisochrysis_lutea.AAC.3
MESAGDGASFIIVGSALDCLLRSNYSNTAPWLILGVIGERSWVRGKPAMPLRYNLPYSDTQQHDIRHFQHLTNLKESEHSKFVLNMLTIPIPNGTNAHRWTQPYCTRPRIQWVWCGGVRCGVVCECECKGWEWTH